MKISNIQARQILDSRGIPTVEVDVWLNSSELGRASVPSGASTGSHEAHELRDNTDSYGGKSVQTAVANIQITIAPALMGMNADNQAEIDRIMCELDGTEQKEHLGANAILAVSLACAKAAAKAKNVLLYAHLNDLAGNPAKSLPMPMMNVLNGGKHATHSTAIQEWMIIPKASKTFAEAVETGARVFQSLKTLLNEHGSATSVGDEGGFTLPITAYDTEALVVLNEACRQAGLHPGDDVVFAIDVAANELFENDRYKINSPDAPVNRSDMIKYLQELSQNFPIVSIEDGLAEDDWAAWQDLTAQSGSDIQIVGDDLLVTNSKRLTRAISEKAANAILIKPNQIGTLTETLQTIMQAKNAGFRTIISHRSGETDDVSIVHIAVGTGADQIKTGSLSRGERIVKYNELLRIEQADETLRLAHPF